ncbi:MAG: glycosyltransferase family 1 protein [Planctomycetes bacterium]|nr:glycosyltransferase family 1 protein [Planctomycetota bacterium]
MPLRFLITTVGSSGDINPFVAIGAELRRRGHAVEMLVNPHYEPRVRAEGLGYRPLGSEEQLLRVLHNPHLAKEMRSAGLVIRELIDETVEPTIQGVEASLREFRPDVVLRHHISLGSRWVCERENIPCVTAILAPVFWFNRQDPCVHTSYQLEKAPRWLMRLRLTISRFGMRMIFDRPLNRRRRALGWPPARDQFFTEALGTPRVLGLWSPHFRGPLPDDPEPGVICGFCFFDRAHANETAPHEVEQFLEECRDAGQPPIVFTLGTSIVHHHNGFYEIAARACRAINRRAALLVGKMEYAPRDLPPGIRAFAYAPFSTIFPNAAAVVHHGGVGTTGQAMRAGKPTVIIPFANDEFDNARRAKALGVSVTLHAGRLNERRLADALSRALEPGPAHAAASLGAKIAVENGPARAADELERLARQNTAV